MDIYVLDAWNVVLYVEVNIRVILLVCLFFLENFLELIVINKWINEWFL